MPGCGRDRGRRIFAAMGFLLLLAGSVLPVEARLAAFDGVVLRTSSGNKVSAIVVRADDGRQMTFTVLTESLYSEWPPLQGRRVRVRYPADEGDGGPAVEVKLLGPQLPVPACRGPKLPPRDDSRSHPDFLEFGNNLRRALKRRDASYLRSLVVAETRFGFGQRGDGFSGFARMGLQDPSHPWWAEAERLVAMGGAWDGKQDTMWFPYVFVTFPYDRYGGGYDCDEYVVVTGSNVNLRAKPNLNSQVTRTLSYDIVSLVVPQGRSESRPLYHLLDEGSWARVRMEEGGSGYVSTRYLCSPLGLRLGFQKIGGRWRLLYSVWGD